MKSKHLLISIPVTLVALIILGALGMVLKGAVEDMSPGAATKSVSLGVPAMDMAMEEYAMDDGMMKREAASSLMAEPAIGIVPPFEPTAGETAAEAEQRLIKTADLSMTVDSVKDAADQITGIAKEAGGFVQHSSISERYDGTQEGYVTIRVPVSAFESTIQAAKAVARSVTEESLGGEDVTEQYTDLQARLRNAKRQEETYLSVLDRASDVEDILAVQRELGNIRAQIESLEGRMKYLENQTDLSTISFYLEEEPRITAPTKEFRPGTAINEAVQALVALGQSLVIGLIWLVIVGGGILIPIAIVVGIPVLLVLRHYRNKGQKRR